MSRFLSFITICVLLISSTLICVDTSNQRVKYKRKRSVADDPEDNTSISRIRTESDLTCTTDETDKISPLTNDGISLSPVSDRISNDPVSILSCEIKKESISEISVAEAVIFKEADLDSFVFDEDMFFGTAAPQIPASTAPKSSIFNAPFRVDYNGQTILLNHETSPISMQEFHDFFVHLCETNRLFHDASIFKGEHFFIKNELDMDVDAEAYEAQLALTNSTMNQDNQTSQNTGSGPVHILHPIFRLAREILVYCVGKGRLEGLEEAKAAGMNMKFDTYFKSYGLKASLLHFACIIKSPNTCEIVKFLIKEIGFDPNQVDSVGLAPLHHVAYNDNSELSEVLISLGADPNIFVKRSDYFAPIHLAAKMKSYAFLKPLIHLKLVDINALNYEGHHVIHFAIMNRSFSFFRALLNDPGILLEIPVVRFAFKMIPVCLAPENIDRFSDVLVEHLINRQNAHVSHLHFIIFDLIINENLSALRSFHSKGFKFDFIHISNHSRPNSSPLLVSVFFDKLESFKFLLSIGISLTENLGFPNLDHIIVLAIYRKSLSIIQHFLDISTTLSDALMDTFLNAILKGDFAHIMKMFLDKFGDGIWTKVEDKIDFETHPNIFTLQVLSF